MTIGGDEVNRPDSAFALSSNADFNGVSDPPSTYGDWLDDETFDPWSEPDDESGAEQSPPVLVATAVSYCVTHKATDHDDGRAWEACRFRQLFYFENPMDEHTLMWSDEIGAVDA